MAKEKCVCGCSKDGVCRCAERHKETLERVKKRILPEEKLLEMADFYKALSDSTRIKIIDALYDSELCVCDIAGLINMTKSATSHQLRYLREMNLVKCVRKGKEVFYSLADEHVKEVFEISKEHIEEKG